jgi:hypothetical protein
VIYLQYANKHKSEDNKIVIPIKPEPMKEHKYIRYQSYEISVITGSFPRVSLKTILSLLHDIDEYDISVFLKDFKKDEKNKLYQILNQEVSDKKDKINELSIAFKKPISPLHIEMIIQNHENPSTKKYLDNKEKVIVTAKNKCLYLSLSLKVPIHLKQIPFKNHDMKTTEINEYKDQIFLNIPFMNTGMIQREEEKRIRKNEYDFYTECYYYLRKHEKLHESLKKIKANPIRLKIHKRQAIYQLLISLSFCEGKGLLLKRFIEYYLIHTFEKIELILLQNYVKIEDFKIVNHTELLFSYHQIFNEEYEYYFTRRSEYIPNISYYDEPDDYLPKKHLYQKNKQNETVSFFTKYPYEIKLLYGDVRIYEYHNEIENDFLVLKIVLKCESVQKILELLFQKITPEIVEEYQTLNPDVDINDKEDVQKYLLQKEYQISPIDLKILSSIFKCGFTIYSNRETKDRTDFSIRFIIDEDVFSDQLPIYNLYLDIDNNHFKTIDNKPQSLTDMFQRGRFKKYMKKHYFKLYEILQG